MMDRKTVVLLVIVALFTCHILGDKIVLKKNYIIKDKPGQYYFKYPKKPLINKKGYLIIRDYLQLLIFSPDNKFIKNIYKKGEGPGEIKSLIGVWPGDKNLFVFNGSPGKMMVFNYNGDLIREVFYKKNIYKADLFTFFNNKFYFTEEEYRNTQKGISIMDTKVKLFSFDMKGEFFGFESIQFPKRYYMGPRTVMNMHFLQYGTNNNRSHYLANNGDYDLKLIDLKKGEIKQLIKKEYKHVKILKEWRAFTHPRTYKTKKKYIRNVLDDILKIRILNNKIWLFTSNFNDRNIIKVDVYDTNAVFIGSLDFPMPEDLHLVILSYLPLTFYKNNLLVFTNLESEGLSLVSYKIHNIPSWAK